MRPRPENVVNADAVEMTLPTAVRYVLRVPTNLALIVASALGYFFISGVLTFGVVFLRHQYTVGQSVATSLLAVIAIAALVGVLASGVSPTRCCAADACRQGSSSPAVVFWRPAHSSSHRCSAARW